MECLRCGNKDPAYFYLGHKGYYCRKCISFSRILLNEEIEPFNYEISEEADDYRFNYKLIGRQLCASKMCSLCLEKSDVLLYCVCGAGKTELVVESISKYLSKGLKVAYAISRKEVVIELSKRFRNIFTNAKITAVYGNHHDILTGDLIVCTCHQLYRYYQTFDLLILDEVDAFPLKGNDTLMNICLRSCKGRIVFSTATVDDGLERILRRRVYKKIELFVRPSNKPLIIPKIRYLHKPSAIIYLTYLLKKMKSQCIIFTSSVKNCCHLYRIFQKIIPCTLAYAALDKHEENIKDFRNGKYQFIFSTTVLERGITIKDINVIIMDYDYYFDESSLVQMLGRVGRNIDNPYGDAYILTNSFNKEINNTLAYLKEANSFL